MFKRLLKSFSKFINAPYKDMDKLTPEQIVFISRFGR